MSDFVLNLCPTLTKKCLIESHPHSLLHIFNFLHRHIRASLGQIERDLLLQSAERVVPNRPKSLPAASRTSKLRETLTKLRDPVPKKPLGESLAPLLVKKTPYVARRPLRRASTPEVLTERNEQARNYIWYVRKRVVS